MDNTQADIKLSTEIVNIPVLNTLTGTCVKIPRDVICRYGVWEAELDKAAEKGGCDCVTYSGTDDMLTCLIDFILYRCIRTNLGYQEVSVINEVKKMSPKPTHVGYFMINSGETVGDATHFHNIMIGQKIGKNTIMFQSGCGFGAAMVWKCNYTPYLANEEHYLIDKNSSNAMLDVSPEYRTVAFDVDGVKPHLDSRHIISTADILKAFQ
jgi:hypothetical protein